MSLSQSSCFARLFLKRIRDKNFTYIFHVTTWIWGKYVEPIGRQSYIVQVVVRFRTLTLALYASSMIPLASLEESLFTCFYMNNALSINVYMCMTFLALTIGEVEWWMSLSGSSAYLNNTTTSPFQQQQQITRRDDTHILDENTPSPFH